MGIPRRDFVRWIGCAAVGGAALAAGALPGCSERKPRNAAQAKRAVARAIFGPELAAKGERLLDSVSLSGDARDELDALLAKARKGVELDDSVIGEHEAAVKRLLREFWLDPAQMWLAVGFPHGPGQCTVFDLYTRPPEQAAQNRTPFPRGRRGRRRGSDDDEA
jgi:hypothetical protein